MPAAIEAALAAVREAGTTYYVDAVSREAAERDFGGVAHGRCLLVAEPKDTEGCTRLVSALNHHGVGCTPRGTGYCQGGQSIPLDTISLSSRRLDWIGDVDLERQTITAGAGATPRRIVHALEGTGLAPTVVPLNLDMSLGGLLSVGGIGTMSHRRGPVIANVLQVDVVGGDGVLRACTREQNADVFNAALGGTGQSGFITQATLRLRPIGERLRVVSLSYDDASTWIEDQIAISEAEHDVHMEGTCWAAVRGLRSTPHGPLPFTQWIYGLHLAVDTRLDVRELLASLRPARKVDEHEIDATGYLHRHERRFAAMVESGGWIAPHPWFEAIVPIERAAEYLERALEKIPAEVGDGHRFMLLRTGETPSSFVCPRSRHAVVLGVFPVAFARSALPKVFSCIDELTDLLLEMDGFRYLSGWLGSNGPAYVRAHFGDRYAERLTDQRRSDPNGLFRSSLFPSGNRP